MTGAQSYAGRYWPTDWRAYYELKGETLVSRQEAAVPPPAPIGDAYTLFPELAALAALATSTGQLSADAAELAARRFDSLETATARTLELAGELAKAQAFAAGCISALAARVTALEALAATPGDPHGWQPPARPVPAPLSGCTCGGIGDTGAHRPPCPWSPNPGGFNPGAHL